jgi:hypothetical protein
MIQGELSQLSDDYSEISKVWCDVKDFDNKEERTVLLVKCRATLKALKYCREKEIALCGLVSEYLSGLNG